MYHIIHYGGDKMKKSIKKQIFAQIFSFMSAITILSFGICYVFKSSIIKDNVKNISQAAEDFSEIEINADDARNYLITRKTDEQYLNTENRLKEYVRKSGTILRISLISYNESVGYYIYDTDQNKIGTKVKYDDYTSSLKDKLLNGKEEWNEILEGKYYSYRPIHTLDSKTCGYIVVEADYSRVNKYFLIFIAGSLCIILISFILTKTLISFIDRDVFVPIKNFSKTALEFTGSVSKGGDINIMDMFKTKKDNEIGYLGNAIKKMISDINDSTENLSNAIYEATHDGMTQMFNKRHYNNVLSKLQKLSSVCVIYFDVNNLKLMNDTLGHDRGDYVIKKAAEYIHEIAGDSGMGFRMGGDEFLVVMSDCTFKEMDSIIGKIDKDSPIILSAETDSIKCALSYGYAYAKGDYSYEALLSEAEENMYKTKTELKKQLNMPDR